MDCWSSGVFLFQSSRVWASYDQRQLLKPVCYSAELISVELVNARSIILKSATVTLIESTLPTTNQVSGCDQHIRTYRDFHPFSNSAALP